MKKYILAAMCVLSLAACKNNTIDRPDTPDNLISEGKMVEVIYDMTVMSAAKGVNKKRLENKGIDPELYVYEKHQIDSLQFAKSNEYYSQDIKQYESIFKRVKLKLQKDKVEFDALVEAEKKVRDSLSKIQGRQKDSTIAAQRKSKEIENRSKKDDSSQISTRQ